MLAGAVAGVMATVPMTAFMEYRFRQLPAEERQPLPPRQIVDNISEKSGAASEVSEGDEDAAALVGHFAYGAAAGAVFGAIGRPGLVSGVAYGVAVWAAGYLGYLPALGLAPGAHEEPRERAKLMFTAHLVWGACLGLISEVNDRLVSVANHE